MYNRTQEIILVLLIAILAIVSYSRLTEKAQPLRLFTAPYDYFRININSATWKELDLLPGIGPSKARGIVNYRTENGSFNQVEDLLSVAGMNERLVNKIRKKIVVK
jgi:competence protein ComEA